MQKIKEVIIVEGKYDKNTVLQVVDAVVIETSGFGVFSDKEKVSLIRKLAEARGIIIFTDGDSAGFLIRNHLKGFLPKDQVKHAYIPDVYGKERRKASPSKEGKLGVEGMNRDIILKALERAGATFSDDVQCDQKEKGGISTADLYAQGLTGNANSSAKRRQLLKKLDLPERMTGSALRDILNALYTRDEFFDLM